MQKRDTLKWVYPDHNKLIAVFRVGWAAPSVAGRERHHLPAHAYDFAAARRILFCTWQCFEEIAHGIPCIHPANS
jgi:hypothetical protein